MNINPAWIALCGTVFGGVGLKFAESWLNRKTVKDDAQAKFRGELSGEIVLLRAAKAESDKRLDEVEKELEETRDKYWKLREEYSRVQAQLLMALQGIKENTGQAEASLQRISDQTVTQTDEPPHPHA